MMGNAGWPEDWEERKAGKGCTMCISREVDDNGYGIRFLRGRYADVFLRRLGSVRGYAIAIWNRDHIAEPTQLPHDHAAGFWLETLQAGLAIEHHFQPIKMNYLTMGNVVPHLHTHIVPRYSTDPSPGGPVPVALLENGRQEEGQLRADVAAMQAAVLALGSPP
jgi:diadenosine tetraphosphate (Ap4A) HIT family hydrolase